MDLTERKSQDLLRESKPIPVVENKPVMEIQDYISKLPRNGNFKSRTLDKITHIVVHHSASKMGQFTVYDFAKWHMDKNGRLKAPAICYHYSIDGDGEIKQVNELTQIAWHAGNANSYSIGVELDGNFEIEHPTDKQIESLVWLIGHINETLGRKLTVIGHREAPNNATVCPAKNMMSIQSKWKV